MNAARFLLIAMVLAAFAPLLASRPVRDGGTAVLPAWPHEFEGRPLTQVPLSTDEQRFLGDFPGAVGHFTDGQRDILMRWVNQPTRKLHPAEDCYRGWGFEVAAARISIDRDGSRWRCFTATRGGVRRQVCEQIRDTDGTHFTDVSSWYWNATLERTAPPWLVVTVATPESLQP